MADRLAAGFGEGRLNQAEFDERVAQAMNAKARGDLSGLFDDLPEPGPAGIPGTPVRGPHSPCAPRSPVRERLLPRPAGRRDHGGRHGGRGGFRACSPGMKTWLTVGVITAIVVYAAGMLSRSRAARDK